VKADEKLGLVPGTWLRGNALVEAIRWHGHNYDAVYVWVMKWDLRDPGISDLSGYLEVTNQHGSAVCKVGDWLVRDIINELFYRSSDEAFTGAYEEAKEP
jgi:hypothetical protein